MCLMFSPFLFDCQDPAEIGGGPGHGSDNRPRLANTALVSDHGVAPVTASTATTTGSQDTASPTGAKPEPPTGRKTQAKRLAVVRESIRKAGISEEATDIIMASWQDGTQKQYASYLNRWQKFCQERKLSPYCTCGLRLSIPFVQKWSGIQCYKHCQKHAVSHHAIWSLPLQ